MIVLPTDEELDAKIRAAWVADETLLPGWKSPPVFVGPWVRTVYLAALVDGYERAMTEAIKLVREH